MLCFEIMANAATNTNSNECTKRKPRFSTDEMMALLNGIKEDRKYILGAFSAEVDATSKKEAWRRVTAKVTVNVGLLSCAVLQAYHEYP